MKAKPYKQTSDKFEPCKIEEATHIELNMPGPFPYLRLPVMIKGKRKGTRNWTWNGDINKPTLRPSIKTTDGKQICHSWVTDGIVKFLGDCTHDLKNKSVPLNDIE